ncbi:MAG: pyridoxine/pyridoxamine 5'-phosphate oxidase, partial [Granulosicoccus sp.]
MTNDNNSTDSNDAAASLIEERRDYTANILRSDDLSSSPVTQFTRWLQDARDKKIL